MAVFPVRNQNPRSLGGGPNSDDYDERLRPVVDVASSLGRVPGVVGVVIFGSVAREDDDARSDVDIVILIEPGSNRPLVRDRTQMIAASRTPNRRVTPVLFSIDGFQRECAERPSFYAHLYDEGIVVCVPGRVVEMRRILRAAPTITRKKLQEELEERTELLSKLSHLDRFNGQFVPALSQLYTLSRSVVILKLLERGRREYDWKRIFDSYARLEPSMRDQLRNMQSLRPYYEHVHDRHKLPADDQYVKEEAVESAIESVTAVARS
jgi:predicted nucleotidyltransferase